MVGQSAIEHTFKQDPEAHIQCMSQRNSILIPCPRWISLRNLKISIDQPQVMTFRMRVNNPFKNGSAPLCIALFELELSELRDCLDVWLEVKVTAERDDGIDTRFLFSRVFKHRFNRLRASSALLSL